MRVIEVPIAFTFCEPVTGKSLDETLSFGDFLHLLMMNPLWSNGYVEAKAQDEILRAYEAVDRTHHPMCMRISEVAWTFLERAAREPRIVHIGAQGVQILAGFGKHPSMARQFLPMQEAVLHAEKESEAPRLTAVET